MGRRGAAAALSRTLGTHLGAIIPIPRRAVDYKATERLAQRLPHACLSVHDRPWQDNSGDSIEKGD